MTATYKEYAQALFMLAAEKEKEEDYAQGLDAVRDVFSENPEYADFLSCPSIPCPERKEAISSAFSGYEEDIVSFLCILCERGRIRELFECIEEYKKLLAFKKNVKNVRVRSFAPLGEEEKSRLKSKLEKKHNCSVSIEYELDSTLIGGLVIEIDGKIIDGSVKTRLEQIKGVIVK